MKYLDGYPELDLLSRALSFTSPSVRVSTRIEAYSCKAINREKRLFKALEQDIKSDLELSTSISPPDQHSAVIQSAFGPLNNASSRKTLWLIIATLNLAFPDHDFSRVSADEFHKEDNSRSVLSTLTSALSQLRASSVSASTTQQQNILLSGNRYASYPPALATLTGFNPLSAGGASSSSSRKRKAASGASPSRSATKASSSAATAKPGKGSAKSKKAAKKRGVNPEDAKTAYFARLTSDINDGLGSSDMPTHPFLRQVLEPIIELNDCEVFTYMPDLASDPHAYQSDDEDEEEYTSHDDEDEEMYDMEFDYPSHSYRRGGRTGGFDDDGDDGFGWDMDGIDLPYSSDPSTTVPPTPTSYKDPSLRNPRRKRAGAQSASKRANGRAWPSMGGEDDDDAFLTSPPGFVGGGVDAGEDDDNSTGGLLWSSNYFFYNKNMRRILFISCWGRKVGGAYSSPAPVAQPLPLVPLSSSFSGMSSSRAPPTKTLPKAVSTASAPMLVSGVGSSRSRPIELGLGTSAPSILTAAAPQLKPSIIFGTFGRPPVEDKQASPDLGSSPALGLGHTSSHPHAPLRPSTLHNPQQQQLV